MIAQDGRFCPLRRTTSSPTVNCVLRTAANRTNGRHSYCLVRVRGPVSCAIVRCVPRAEPTTRGMSGDRGRARRRADGRHLVCGVSGPSHRVCRDGSPVSTIDGHGSARRPVDQHFGGHDSCTCVASGGRSLSPSSWGCGVLLPQPAATAAPAATNPVPCTAIDQHMVGTSGDVLGQLLNGPGCSITEQDGQARVSVAQTSPSTGSRPSPAGFRARLSPPWPPTRTRTIREGPHRRLPDRRLGVGRLRGARLRKRPATTDRTRAALRQRREARRRTTARAAPRRAARRRTARRRAPRRSGPSRAIRPSGGSIGGASPSVP